MVCRRAGRTGIRAALVLAAAACSLALVLTGCSGSSGMSGALARQPPKSPGSTYTLMQMNLCLSGLGSCYVKVAYPAVLDEAVARIRSMRPDAVTLNETCRNDVALIARRTGYQLRFVTVIYDGKPLPCIHPGGRGVFGDAVLTKAAVERSESREFTAQAGIERRRWLCVVTHRSGVNVCTAHIATRDATEVSANGPQCAELRALLAHRAAGRTVIFGGDLNRRASCAPGGFWARTDRYAGQAPGLQQVYGTGALRSPSAQVVPAVHTDHDILVVRARLSSQR